MYVHCNIIAISKKREQSMPQKESKKKDCLVLKWICMCICHYNKGHKSNVKWNRSTQTFMPTHTHTQRIQFLIIKDKAMN